MTEANQHIQQPVQPAMDSMNLTRHINILNTARFIIVNPWHKISLCVQQPEEAMEISMID